MKLQLVALELKDFRCRAVKSDGRASITFSVVSYASLVLLRPILIHNYFNSYGAVTPCEYYYKVSSDYYKGERASNGARGDSKEDGYQMVWEGFKRYWESLRRIYKGVLKGL